MTWLESVLAFNLPTQSRESRQFARWVRKWLAHPSPKVRYAAAAAASEIGLDPRITSALMRRIASSNEHPLVRGQCLESLKPGWLASKGPLERRAFALVLKCLRDPDANVRFWACYVSGQKRMRCSQGHLAKLIGDPAIAEMGWTVGYEAAEALKAIRGEPAWEKFPTQRLPSPYPPLC